MATITSSSQIGYTADYLTVDGRPWFPVMGEIHYSRVRPQDWEEELCKMKAGGVDIVSCYSIWIHHEEIEKEYDFTGCRDLRGFLLTVQKCGLHCVLRIGPWAHGEARNGGFPDWLVKKEKEGKLVLRSNDPAYLIEARRWYQAVYEQVKGLFLDDGGPILGIQIENEYGHCGGLTGPEGEEHMRTLRRMAEEIGYHVPLFTATGWGGAVTGGMLPVMGGYCEAPWDQRLTEIEPSGNYVFTAERNDHGIGSDYGLGEGITFDMTKFPYLTAELGGGLQVTKHRRPIASARDIAAMSMVKLGSGCNLLGYYMYHGGTNPEGKRTTLQESRETGYPNDLPVLSYDFNAPVKEYGQLTDTYRRIRMLAMFVHDYEEILCRTHYICQPGNAADADDFTSLRTAVRCTGPEEGKRAGFYFVNNYQRRCRMTDHPGASLRAFAEDGRTVLADFGTQDIADGDYFFYPFNLPIGENAVLKSANAVPLCILNNNAETPEEGEDLGIKKSEVYVFYLPGKTQDPHYVIEQDPGDTRIITLTEEEALHASKLRLGGRDYLVISAADIIVDASGLPKIIVCTQKPVKLRMRTYPALPNTPEGWHVSGENPEGGIFTEYEADEVVGGSEEVKTSVRRIPDEPGRWELHIENLPKDISCMLYVDYEGESAQLLQSGKLVADSFYTGQKWEIEAGRFADPEKGKLDAVIEVAPLSKDTPVYLQKWPEMTGGAACNIRGISSAVVRVLTLVLTLALFLVGCGTEKISNDVVYPEDKYRTAYEVFVYSFYDSNGDGIGDLPGLTQQLDYINDGNAETLTDLECSEIWTMPIFPSPTYHKYDVTDYCAIDPQYGTMEDFDAYLSACHERGIRVILDLPLNHTSTEHPWFVTAVQYLREHAAYPENVLDPAQEEGAAQFPEEWLAECPELDYYNFAIEKRAGYESLDGTPWYYEARFWSGMPDLNLDSDKVRQELSDVALFWLDKGVDGFRLDAVTSYYTDDHNKSIAFLEWLNQKVKERNPEAYLVGEAWENQAVYSRYYESGIDSLFDFSFAGQDGMIAQVVRGSRPVGAYIQAMADEEALYASYSQEYINAPFYTNHDMARSTGYYAYDDGTKTKLAGALNLLMTGNAFVYYGEELGLKGSGKDENKRAPMPWLSDPEEAGMCQGPPGMDPQAAKFGSLDKQQEDPDSVWNYYRSAIRIRNAYPVIARGRTVPIPELTEGSVGAFLREAKNNTEEEGTGQFPVLIVINAGEESTELDLSGADAAAGYRTLSAQLPEGTAALEGDHLTLPAGGVAVLTR